MSALSTPLRHRCSHRLTILKRCTSLPKTLLVAGDFERAVACLTSEPPLEHLQKHIALRAIAMRLSDDEEYRRYYDYDRFVFKTIIETPEGYDSLEAFNTALAAAIEPLHATSQRPLDQTLYGGTQSFRAPVE